MKSTVYKFDYKVGELENRLYYVRDFFQYYTTGIEKIITDNPKEFNITSRQNAERPESIVYDIYGDPDLADIFVAINNQNYLWATPFDLDAFQDAIDFRMDYVKLLMKNRIQATAVLDIDGNPILDVNGRPEVTYNNVGMECYDKVSEDIHAEDDKARQIVVPSRLGITNVQRLIKDYFEKRTVI